MTPEEFVAKWRAVQLKERSAAQEHFIDLCRLLDEPTPAEADPTGDAYCFERGASKEGGGDGWADVWKRHHFAWEYKGKRANLDAAFTQLRQYALALENPPLLIVSDMAQNSENWSFYGDQANPTDFRELSRQPLLRSLRVDLTGVRVTIYQLARSGVTGRIQQRNLRQFWDDYFLDMGADTPTWIDVEG